MVDVCWGGCSRLPSSSAQGADLDLEVRGLLYVCERVALLAARAVCVLHVHGDELVVRLNQLARLQALDQHTVP